MDEKLILVGADVGNGYTKIDFGINQYSYPSLVSAGHDRGMAQLMENFDLHEPSKKCIEDQIGVLDVKIRDVKNDTQEHYFCGFLASREGVPRTQWADDKGSNQAGKALLLAGIALGMRENKSIMYLAVSLPVKNYKRFKDSYEQHMTGTFEVEFMSGPFKRLIRTIQIIRCRVYPEGMGVFIREIYSYHKPELRKGYHCIIAPGFRTTEFILFSDGKPVDDLSGSLEIGIATAHKRVGNRLSETLGVDYSEHDIDKIFMDSSPGKRGTVVKEMCANELPRLAEQIISKLRVKWQDIWLQVETFLVSDGGGSVLFPDFHRVLIEATNSKVELVDLPEYATAVGNRTAASLALAGGKLNGG